MEVFASSFRHHLVLILNLISFFLDVNDIEKEEDKAPAETDQRH